MLRRSKLTRPFVSSQFLLMLGAVGAVLAGVAYNYRKGTKEPGRDEIGGGRTARDSTGINPEERALIDSRMPIMPPA